MHIKKADIGANQQKRTPGQREWPENGRTGRDEKVRILGDDGHFC